MVTLDSDMSLASPNTPFTYEPLNPTFSRYTLLPVPVSIAPLPLPWRVLQSLAPPPIHVSEPLSGSATQELRAPLIDTPDRSKPEP